MAVFTLVTKAIITWCMIRLLYTADTGVFFLGMLLACFFGSEEGPCQPSLEVILFPGVAAASQHIKSLPNPHEDMLDIYILSLATLYVVLGDRFRALLLGVWLHYFYMDTDFRKCWAYAALAMVVLMFSYLRRAYQMFWPPVSALLYNSIRMVFSGLCAYVVGSIESLTPSLPPPPPASPPLPPPLTISPMITTAIIEPFETPMPAMVDNSTQSSFPASPPTMVNSSVQTISPWMTNSGVQTSSPTMTDSSVQTYSPIMTDCGVQTSSPIMSNASMQTNSPVMVNNGVQANSLTVVDDSMQTRLPKVVGRSIQGEKDSPIEPCCSRKTPKYHTSRSSIINISGIPVARRRRVCKDLRRTRRTSTIPVLLQPLSPYPSSPPSTDSSLLSSSLSSSPFSRPLDPVDPAPLSSGSLCEPEIAPPGVSTVAPGPESYNVSMDASATILDGTESMTAVEPAPLIPTVSPSAGAAPVGSTSPLPIVAPASQRDNWYSSLSPKPQSQEPPSLPLDSSFTLNLDEMVHDSQALTNFIFDLAPVDTEGDSVMEPQWTERHAVPVMGNNLTQNQEIPAMGDGSMQWQQPTVRMGFGAYRDNTDAESDDGNPPSNPPSNPTGSHLNNEYEDFFVPPVKIEDFPEPPKSKYFDRIDEEEGEEDKDNNKDDNKGGQDVQMHDFASITEAAATTLSIMMMRRRVRRRFVRYLRGKSCVSNPTTSMALKIKTMTDLYTRCGEVPWVRHRCHRLMNKHLKKRMMMISCTWRHKLSEVRYRSMKKRIESLRRR